jgi:exopolyphosphatase/guanosine-5'-triphosphate,3'-diphosphate pyrophosphatase
VASKSFKIGSVRLLEGKELKSDWDKMKKWISDYIDPNRAEMVAVGTGGNINKLLNIAVNKISEDTISVEELRRLRAHVASFSLEDRINKLRLNPDRADVIVPASQIYLSAMEWAGAKTIVVPDLGLKDGMILMIYDRHLARKRK